MFNKHMVFYICVGHYNCLFIIILKASAKDNNTHRDYLLHKLLIDILNFICVKAILYPIIQFIR